MITCKCNSQHIFCDRTRWNHKQINSDGSLRQLAAPDKDEREIYCLGCKATGDTTGLRWSNKQQRIYRIKTK